MRSTHPFTRRAALAVAFTASAGLALAACSNESGASDGALNSVNIIAPADPGGGWDQTARTMSQVMTESNLVSSAPVQNIGGAGGTVGLANMATSSEPHTLMITGSVMIGAVETNASEVRVEEMTPIAMLTEEPLVVVVPAESEFNDINGLVNAIKERGPEVTVTGGSAGGIDHILAGQMLTNAGVSAAEVPTTLNYVANSGGGEAVTLLLGNKAQAGISGAAEFIEQINAGQLKALAVSGAERTESLPDVPTLTEAGIDVELVNWRGLLAPGDISDEDKAALTELVTQMHDQETWTDALEKNGWADAFLTGNEFETFIGEDIAAAQETLKAIGLIE